MSRRNQMRALVRGLALMHMLVACGDDAGPSADDAGTPFDGGAIGLAPPDVPWLAMGEPPIAPPAETSDALPAGSVDDCGPGEARFFGSATCTPVGSPCPSGDFAETLPASSPVVYVQPGATGGDGTASAPFGTLGEFSIGRLRAGTIIALAKGVHDGVLRLGNGIEVHGACAAETTISAAAPSDRDGVVAALGDGVVVRDLRIADSSRPGVSATGAGRSVELAGVEISGVELIGVLVDTGAGLSADGLVIRGTRPRASDSAFGRGLGVEIGSAADLSRVVLEHNRETGIVVNGASTSVTLTDATVADTGAQLSDLRRGRGIVVQNEAALQLTRGLLLRNRTDALYVSRAGTMLLAEDLVVRETDSQISDGLGGSGVSVLTGSAARLTRARIAQSREAGVFALDPSTLEAEDLVIEDGVGLMSSGALGRAITVQVGASVSVTRGRFERNRELALYVVDEGSEIELIDVVVRGTTAGADGLFGRALNVELGASGRATRALFDDNREAAVAALDAGTTLVMEDVAVRDTQPRESDDRHGRGIVNQYARVEVRRALLERNHVVSAVADGGGASSILEDLVIRDSLASVQNGLFGRGLTSQDAAITTVERATIERSAEIGAIALHPGTRLDLTDVVISDSLGRPGDGHFGRGFESAASAQSTLTRVAMRGNREMSIFVAGSGTLVATGLVIEDTLERACADSSCTDQPWGTAVVAASGSSITLTDFELTRAALCGVLVGVGGDVQLADGEVSESTIGACVQDPAFDIERITSGVRYRDNGVNLEATTMPLPDAALPVDVEE